MTVNLLDEAFDIQRPSTDAPGSFLHAGAISTLSSILAPHTFFQFGSQRLRPNLFILMIAKSSAFRKSEGIRWSRRVLSDIDGDYILPSTGSPEGLIESLKVKTDGIMAFDEFARFLARSKKDFASDLPQFLCELADCSPIRERRREGGLQAINEPVVSLIGASAPGPLYEYLGAKDCASGLLPRFLLIEALERDVARQPFPKPMDLTTRAGHILTLKSIAQDFKTRGEREFVFTDEARDLFVNFDAELHATDVPELLSPFVERACPMTLKLACIFGYGRTQSMSVEPPDVAAAATWIRSSLETAKGLVDILEEREEGDFTLRDAAKIRKAIDRLLVSHKKLGAVPHSDLLRAAHLSSDGMRRAVLYLIEAGEIMPMKAGATMRWMKRPSFDESVQSQDEKQASIATSLIIAKNHFYAPREAENKKNGRI
jgi:hypothetical protein